MMSDNLPTEICDVLYQLGLTANYTGFFHTAYAAQLALQSPQRLCLVTKWLYPDVAAHYNTTPAAVERNIRASVFRIWNEASPQLNKLSCVPLSERPTSARFLAILVSYLSHPPPV